MKRLTQKHCTRIARLFNSITVAEGMMRTANKEKNHESYTLWEKSAENAARILRDEFGIRAIGVRIDGNLE
jgi:hypothetical protein